MKRISKVLSMFLVVVMCFGLFSTSAFATAMVSFDFSGGNNAAENTNNAGGGFDFNPVGSSGSQSNSNGGFDFSEPSQPANVEPQQQATNNGPTLSTQNPPILTAPAPSSSDPQWTFVAEKTTVSKSMSDADATVKIKATDTAGASGFNSDSFSGFRYDTSPEGLTMKEMKQGEHYSISANALVLYGSWLKSLPVGVYYFFGIRTNDTPQRLAYISVNSGSFGPFTMYGAHYNKNATSVVETSAGGDMSSFYGYGVVGVTDSSYNKILTADVDYTSNSSGVWLKASYLNSLPEGTYTLVGFTTPSDFKKDQVVIGDFYIESGLDEISYTMDGDPYDKSKEGRFLSVRADNPASEKWLYTFSSFKVTNLSGSYTHQLQKGVDYTFGDWNESTDTYSVMALSVDKFLDTLDEDRYNVIGIASLSSGTVEKLLGTFTVKDKGTSVGDFTIYNSPYDKSKPDAERYEVYAQAGDSETAGKLTKMTYAISGPTNRALSADDLRIVPSDWLVAIKQSVLDTLADGTYTFTATYTSGTTTVQKTLGTFTVTSGDLGEVFSIANSPYDKSKDDRKLVAAVAKATGVVENVTGVAITGPENRTLTNSEYYKQADVKKTPGWVSIQKDVLDKLPEGTYNFILTVKTGAAPTQINAGQFTVKASVVDAEFVIANSPYDKNSTESKAVGAVPKTTGVIANITGVAISGTESRTLTSSEYYKQPDKDGKAGYVVILKDVLNTLSDGTYNFLVTISTGTSSVQKNAGQFVVKTNPVDFGEFEITGTPFDKNADAPASVVATAKENGKDPVLRNFSIAGVGSMTAPLTLKSSDFKYTEGTDSKPRKLELKADFVKTLADGDYYIYAEATSGVSATQGTIGIFTVKTGTIPFGTFKMDPDTYDKNAKKPTEVVATEESGHEKDMEKFTGFAITTVGGSFTSTRTLSSSEYKKTDTSVTILASVLGSLADGEYKLIGTATTGLTTEQVPIGIFYVKSGDVTFGEYTIDPSSFNKNDANRADLSVDRTAKADTRFTPNSFSIAGLTNTSFSQVLNVNQYTINDPTTNVMNGWLTLKKNVLDTLPDGNYKLVCTATVGNVSGQVDLGTFTVVSGEVNYGSYAIHKSPYDKNDSSSAAIYSEETHGWGMLQYFNGFAISGVTNTSFNQVLIGSQYTVNDKKTKVTISEDVLNALPDGDYNLLGFATIGQASSQVNMGMFTVTSSYGNFEVFNSPYDKNDKHAQAVFVTAEKKADMQKMTGFGVAAVNGSYVQALSVNNYYRSGDGYSVVLEESYLDTLADGQYYLIGFPTYGSTTEQVILGTFIVKSGGITGNAMLTPDGQVWYSGSDPLTFYSEIHDLAGKGWNYKPYDWGNIVPDVRYSTYSDMRSPTSVRIDQYWDLNYGYIMLGANFLNSLSAEHTYYLQVVDARDPEGLYSNVVSFRVGPTLRALDTDKHVLNSTRSLRFRSSEPISRVYVGNIELTDPADYGVSWDGRTVTLSFEFLNKRSGGNTYTIKVLTTSGEYASTTFQVLTTAQGSASPRTGDESNLGLWAAFLLLSGTAVVILLPKLKKQNF